jgi:hypothetical protein
MITDESSFEWRVHLARRHPGRAAGAVGLALGAGAAAYVSFGALAPALVSGGLVLAAAGEFLFPTTYRLTAEWAEVRNPFGWRRIAWKEVKRVHSGKEEIKLSPLAHAGRREAFRGVLLRCEGNQPAVLEAIDRFRNAATGARADG